MKPANQMSLLIENNLGSFTDLTDLGIKNFFTYDNVFWGNMKLMQRPKAIFKYEEIFKEKDISTDFYIHIAADHNDNVQVLTQENLNVYKLFNHDKNLSPNLYPVSIKTDSLITKLKNPQVITPADCAVIVLTGIDNIDGQRFTIFIHAGFTGTYLNIVKKSINQAHTIYDFENEDLEVFIFPHLTGYTYHKGLEDKRSKWLINNKEWENCISLKDDEVYINFSKKLYEQIIELGITNITQTNIDTFKSHTEKKLFSQKYMYDNNLNSGLRFAVGICIS